MRDLRDLITWIVAITIAFFPQCEKDPPERVQNGYVKTAVDGWHNGFFDVEMPTDDNGGNFHLQFRMATLANAKVGISTNCDPPYYPTRNTSYWQFLKYSLHFADTGVLDYYDETSLTGSLTYAAGDVIGLKREGAIMILTKNDVEIDSFAGAVFSLPARATGQVYSQGAEVLDVTNGEPNTAHVTNLLGGTLN
jgi:hypothetical protein